MVPRSPEVYQSKWNELEQDRHRIGLIESIVVYTCSDEGFPTPHADDRAVRTRGRTIVCVAIRMYIGEMVQKNESRPWRGMVSGWQVRDVE